MEPVGVKIEIIFAYAVSCLERKKLHAFISGSWQKKELSSNCFFVTEIPYPIC